MPDIITLELKSNPSVQVLDLGGPTATVLDLGQPSAILAELYGQQGLQGPPGPTGPQGPQGDTGATGDVTPALTQALLDAQLAATDAQTAQAAAEAVYDTFDDRYLGAKSAPPALDNDGNPLQIGALYFDTVLNDMQVWDGAGWQYLINLTGAELLQLQNIDTTTISVAQWAFLGLFDQGLASTDDVLFNTLAVTNTATTRSNLGLTIGADVQAYSANLDTYAANPLTASELQQLQNIGAVIISAVNWGHVASLNQDLATTDDVTFNTVAFGNAPTTRTNLGVAIGSDVQAYSANLDTYAANPLTAAELQQLQNIGANTFAAADWTAIAGVSSAQFNSLAALTTAELGQIANIGATTISAAQWGYVGNMDQNVQTNAGPTFASVSATGAMFGGTPSAGSGFGFTIAVSSDDIGIVPSDLAGGYTAASTFGYIAFADLWFSLPGFAVLSPNLGSTTAEGMLFESTGRSYFQRDNGQANNSNTIDVMKGTTTTFLVQTDGDVQNTNNSYTAISDIRLKHNIEPVDGSIIWDLFKQLSFNWFDWIHNPDADRQMGVIAQQALEVMPELVTHKLQENGPLKGEVQLGFNYSGLAVRTAVVLQKAMDRIEELERRLAALESQED